MTDLSTLDGRRGGRASFFFCPPGDKYFVKKDDGAAARRRRREEMDLGSMMSNVDNFEAFGGRQSGFFDRISGSVPRDAYDIAELQDCRQHLRMCAERIAELESMNIDLENRLESQANDSIRFETEATESQRRWKEQYEALEKECEMWRQSNSQLELKNHQLRNQLLRTERELHGILQKKYEFMDLARKEERERVRTELSSRDTEPLLDDDGATKRPASMQLYDAAVLNRDGAATYGTTPAQRRHVGTLRGRHQNPHSASPEEVRLGRCILALSDFFGLSNNPRGGW